MVVFQKQHLSKRGDTMSIRIFGIIAMVVIVCIIAAFTMPYQFRKMFGIILAVLLLVFVGMFCAYMLNPSFKQSVNINFNKVSQHTYILSNQQYSVPLPANTTLNYRFSDTGANYITKSNLNEVVLFYSNIATQNSLENITENGIIHLSFSYEENEFKVTVKQDESKRNYYIAVDLLNDTD